MSVPRIKVFSNTTAKPYPDDPNAVGDQLIQHLISRVEFVREIEAMYTDGARIFVEVGPGNVLTGLLKKTIPEEMPEGNHPSTLHQRANVPSASFLVLPSEVRMLQLSLFHAAVARQPIPPP